MKFSYLGVLMLLNLKIWSQFTYFKVHDYDNSYNEGNILLRESDTLYSFGIAIDKTFGEFNRTESFDKFGNTIFEKNHFHLDGDAESFVQKGDTIYLMTIHRVINGDTINLSSWSFRVGLQFLDHLNVGKSLFCN